MVAVISLTACFSMNAYATLLGDTIEGSYEEIIFATTNDPNPPPADNLYSTTFGGSGSSAVVGAGVEFVGGFSSANFNDNTVTLSYSWDFSQSIGEIFGMPIFPVAEIADHFLFFTDLNWVGTPGIITGLTQTSGLLPQDWNISTGFTDDSISFFLENTGVTEIGGFELVFNIETDHATVPEPSTILLFCAGLIGVFMRRRASA